MAGNKEAPNDAIWNGDLLNRKEEAILLEDFLVKRVGEREELGQTASYVLNLDAGWGKGKTFFIERFQRQLQASGYIVAHVNAWADDFADDPLIPVISAIESAFPKTSTASTKSTARNLMRLSGKLTVFAGKHLAKGALTRMLGKEGAELAGAIGEVASKQGAAAAEELIDTSSEALSERLIKGFEEGKQTVAQFRSLLAELARKKEVKAPLFVLVDELDRCRPTYAIALLERIKHLFEVDGIVFVVATDTEQLRHSIGAVYGSGFDGRGYLLRFFDRSYRLADPGPEMFIANLFLEHKLRVDILSSPPRNDHLDFISGLAVDFSLSLREIERCFDMLRTVVTLWDQKCKIELLYLWPLIIAECRGDRTWIDSFKNPVKELAPAHPPTEKYRVIFTGYNEAGREITEPKKPLLLLKDMLEMARSSLPELLRTARPTSSGAKSWLYNVFSDEFRLRQNNQYSITNPPHSHLAKYPQLVRAVGRLTDTSARTAPPNPHRGSD